MRLPLALLLFFQFTLLPVCFSQRIEKSSEMDVDLAQQLKDEYPEDDLVCLACESTVEFDYNARKGKVTVSEQVKKSLISLSQNPEIHTSLFYNDQSIISDIVLRNNSGDRSLLKIKDEYYQSSDFFYSDARVKYFEMPFKMAGSLRNLSYEKEYLDVKYFTSLYFHDIYPCKGKKIIFIVPDWLDIEFKEMNFEGFDIEKSRVKDEKEGKSIYTFKLKNLASFSQEASSPGPSYIYPHIMVQAKSYEKGGKKTNLFDSVDDLYAWYHSLTNQLKDSTQVFNTLVEDLINGKASDLEKAKAIYYWVQENIRYVAFEDGLAGFKPDESQSVFRKRFGDCKGMANLTKQMLNLAGMEARLTWLGTRRIAYDYSFPSLAVDNHMICTLMLDEEKYFLDPTEKYNPFFNYAERIQGRAVLIEDGDTYLIDKIPSATAEENAQSYVSQVKLEGEQLVSDVKRIYKGESKSSMLYQINTIEQSALDEGIYQYLTRSDKNLDAKEIKASSFEELDSDLSIEYELIRDNAVSDFGEEIYIDLDYYEAFSDFELKDRKTDYLFPHKIKLKREVSFEVPTGFQLGELPKEVDQSFSDFSFKLSYQQEGNLLIYSNVIEIKKAVLSTDEFERWNNCIKALNAFYQQPLTLTKKS